MDDESMRGRLVMYEGQEWEVLGEGDRHVDYGKTIERIVYLSNAEGTRICVAATAVIQEG